MKIQLTLLLTMIFTWSFAQEDLKLLTSAGSEYSNVDVSLSWSLGEILIKTVESDKNIVTQGFHQSFETTVYTPKGDIKVNVYPNPTAGDISFEGDVFITEDVKFIMYDVLGKKLIDEMIPKGNAKFTRSIIDFASASYYLTFIINGESYNKTFKIHKID